MEKKALWILVVVWSIACLCGSHGCQEEERIALLALKAAFDLPSWEDFIGPSWGSNSNCCSWVSVKCNPTTGRVTELKLFGLGHFYFSLKNWYLNASLLLPFEELKSLDLSDNSLRGLSKLEVLDLSHNSLDNSILPVLGIIPSLRRLMLQDNNLRGTLHLAMFVDKSGGFSNLKELDLSYNAVDAAATAEGIKNLSHLENLHLDGVHLTHAGTVLRALGALSSLKILSLQGNTLEGTITAQDFHNFSKMEQLILDNSLLNTSIEILSSLGPLNSLRLLSSSNTGLIGNLQDQMSLQLVSEPTPDRVWGYSEDAVPEGGENVTAQATVRGEEGWRCVRASVLGLSLQLVSEPTPDRVWGYSEDAVPEGGENVTAQATNGFRESYRSYNIDVVNYPKYVEASLTCKREL
ncbi:hypothetical protein BT93_C2428 [Corymbia citriodora subsp. variegata]|nr:hypothetical protein BT93_C2428 [Corymbia citriodora subsp. variegata]